MGWEEMNLEGTFLCPSPTSPNTWIQIKNPSFEKMTSGGAVGPGGCSTSLSVLLHIAGPGFQGPSMIFPREDALWHGSV